MALVKRGRGALRVGVEVVLRSIGGGDDVGGVVDRVRPGIRDEELVVGAQAFLEIHGKSVVAGGAGGQVWAHVAEGNGDADAETFGSHDLTGKGDALSGALSGEELRERAIKAGTTEEVEQGWGDVWAGRAQTAGSGTGRGGDRKRVRCWGSNGVDVAARQNSRRSGPDGRICGSPVIHQEGRIDGINVDRAIQVTSSRVVVGDVDGEVAAKVTLDAERDLLHIRGVIVDIGRKP